MVTWLTIRAEDWLFVSRNMHKVQRRSANLHIYKQTTNYCSWSWTKHYAEHRESFSRRYWVYQHVITSYITGKESKCSYPAFCYEPLPTSSNEYHDESVHMAVAVTLSEISRIRNPRVKGLWLQPLKEVTVQGWPVDKRTLSFEIEPYFRARVWQNRSNMWYLTVWYTGDSISDKKRIDGKAKNTRSALADVLLHSLRNRSAEDIKDVREYQQTAS